MTYILSRLPYTFGIQLFAGDNLGQISGSNILMKITKSDWYPMVLPVQWIEQKAFIYIRTNVVIDPRPMFWYLIGTFHRFFVCCCKPSSVYCQEKWTISKSHKSDFLFHWSFVSLNFFKILDAHQKPWYVHMMVGSSNLLLCGEGQLLIHILFLIRTSRSQWDHHSSSFDGNLTWSSISNHTDVVRVCTLFQLIFNSGQQQFCAHCPREVLSS